MSVQGLPELDLNEDVTLKEFVRRIRVAVEAPVSATALKRWIKATLALTYTPTGEA